MYIERVHAVTDEVFEAVCRLVPEIGAHKPIPTRPELNDLVDSGTSQLWVARYPGEYDSIAGMFTLALYRVPTGLRSIVEDMAVASDRRRLGIARALMLNAIEVARAAGADVMTLSSNPAREAANRLYQSMGFERRETNAYIFRLK
jgi:ribosomal protein S18 acetylase RimI-like enzyme